MAITNTRSPLYGANTGAVSIDAGQSRSQQQPGKSEAIGALVARSGQPCVEGQANTKAGEEAKEYSGYSFRAQFAEVRINADLGQMRVSRMVGAFGAGRILNAKTARSQFMGGMVWGQPGVIRKHRLRRALGQDRKQQSRGVSRADQCGRRID